MSRYRVEWDPSAEDELARIWLQASDPQAVTAAQARADQLLAQDPIRYGRYLSEGLFCLDVPPVSLAFTVDSVNDVVEVTGVRSCP